MKETERLAYQPSLDGLRAAAVAAVVVYHAYPDALPGGFLGVDAFFVLSGFLITSLLLNEWSTEHAISLGSFWLRRARRLFPALLLVLAAVGLYAAFWLPADELNRFRGDGLASLFYVANWRLVLTGRSYFDLFATPPPLRHLWSLAIEEQFYLVWPLVVLGCLRFARRGRAVLIGVCVAGIVASLAAMSLLYESADPSRAYYGTDARVHTILIGALLAMLAGRTLQGAATPTSRRVVQALGVVGAVVSVWMIATLQDTAAWFYHGGSLVFAVSMAAVVAASVQRVPSPLRKGLALAPLVAIGRISYGIYLWHWPIQVALTPTRTGLDGVALGVVRIGATLAISYLSFRFVEQPIRRGALRGLPARLAAPVGFALVAGLLIITTQGAEAPAAFLQVNGNAYYHVEPPATERVVDGSRPLRVMLVGDSVAASLSPGLKFQSGDNGVSFSALASSACSTLDGLAVDPTTGKRITWVHRCRGVPAAQLAMLDRSKPDVVMMIGVWETQDRFYGGRKYKFGTPASDALILDLLERTRKRLTADGAHFAILTLPPRVEPTGRAATPGLGVGAPHLNQLYRKFAREHPGSVKLLDLADWVCPGGPPCKQYVDGLVLRPDGLHFSFAKGSGWAATKLLAAIHSSPELTRKVGSLAVRTPSQSTP